MVDYKLLSNDKASLLLKLLRVRENQRAENWIDSYKPYDWQKRSHAAGRDCGQVLDMCANQVGKTYSVKAELSYHATGLYPDWWEGRVFKRPVQIWACGTTNENPGRFPKRIIWMPCYVPGFVWNRQYSQEMS